MNNLVELSDKEIDEYLDEFYKTFEDGYQFEEFVKYFLEKIGLDEVFVTQRSRDGGVDLTCTKVGISGLSNLDETKYYVQAKKYIPTSTISVKVVRELRGVMPLNHKGILVTTGRFSKDAISFAEEDSVRQIILIDGRNLIQQCINAGLGFNLKPVFDKDFMENIEVMKIIEEDKDFKVKSDSLSYEVVVEKRITANDIRATILRIPSEIKKNLLDEQKNISILFNKDKVLKLNISKDRSFVSGLTQLYRDYELITSDNIIIPKIAMWKISDGKISVDIK